MKKALITGVTGQDGAYLSEFLLKKGYIVHGIKRRSSLFNRSRIDHLYQDPHVDNRNFTIQVLRFDNGSFVSITEHQDKIGGVLASIGTDSIPVSSTIIPAKSESLFLKLISERISSIIKGINIISAFIPQELDSKIANALMSKIKEILEK